MGLNYVLITPAHNERPFLEGTIHSVINQNILPLKWVIVDDGSTDGTGELSEIVSKNYNWIEVLRLAPHTDRNFASKVFAFNAGYARLKNISYDLIGNLDADVSFDQGYFEYLANQFENDPALGVAGTHYLEGDFHSFKDSYINVHHVNGQVQLFRRECFEAIGGYQPSRYGGIDWIAVTAARMKGWKTYSFDGMTFIHHRPMGTAGSNTYVSRFNYGKKDFFLGNHILWELFRVAYQCSKKPYILGGLLLLFGYGWAWLRGYESPINEELKKFHQQEQLGRLRELIGYMALVRR
jgi:poly-beta-1,6-N-acetyl-D-glucosamine synthase